MARPLVNAFLDKGERLPCWINRLFNFVRKEVINKEKSTPWLVHPALSYSNL
jgi:hypothetical protein